jgi:hypothetical protein
MKKFGFLSLAIFLLFGFIPHASANESVINLVSKPHQLFDGTFLNDDLAKDLLPAGSLGRAIEQKRNGARTWIIDAALLDEVSDMADGYLLKNELAPTGELIAKEWLARLLLATSGDRIIALPYGNPDIALAKRLAPSELRLYSAYGYERIAFHLNRRIPVESSAISSSGESALSAPLRKKYTQDRRALTTLSSVVSDPEVQAQRAKLAVLLAPTLNKDEQRIFSYNAESSVAKTLNRLRITGGKYQIAAKTGKLPVTVINDFNVPVIVNIKFMPNNSRLQVSNVVALQIPANSRTQLAMPFSVIAPGATTVIAEITNKDGVVIGKPSKLAINLTIFDSKVTGFTIGAAVLLFVAALTQTIRRVRKGRNENK